MDTTTPTMEGAGSSSAEVAVTSGQAVRLQRSRLLAIALVVAGAVVLLVGWIGTASAVHAAQQLPFIISGGLGGVSLIGLGAAMWLSSDLADEWTKLDLVEAALTRLAETETGAATATKTGSQ